MKKTYLYWGIIITVVLVVLVSITGLLAIQVRAQDQSASDLAERLRQRGVPVLYVDTISRIPYVIKIAIQSASNDQKLQVEDNWNMILARREATISYRLGPRINSYQLVVYNQKGEKIFSSEKFLYADDLSQTLSIPANLPLESQRTKEVVLEELRLDGFSLDSLDIIPENVPGNNGQILIIQVSAADVTSANRWIDSLMGSLLKMLDTINSDHGTYITLCHLRVVDKEGTVLLDYVEDTEIGYQQWSTGEGLRGNWYSQPELESESLVPTSMSTNPDAYPPPSTATPVTPPTSYP